MDAATADGQMGNLVSAWNGKEEKKDNPDDVRPWNKDPDIQRGVENSATLKQHAALFFDRVIQAEEPPEHFVIYEPRGCAPSCVSSADLLVLDTTLEQQKVDVKEREVHKPLVWLGMRLTELGVVRAEREKSVDKMKATLASSMGSEKDKTTRAWNYAVEMQNAYAVWLFQLRLAASTRDEPTTKVVSKKRKRDEDGEVSSSSRPAPPPRRIQPKRAKLTIAAESDDEDAETKRASKSSSSKDQGESEVEEDKDDEDSNSDSDYLPLAGEVPSDVDLGKEDEGDEEDEEEAEEADEDSD